MQLQEKEIKLKGSPICRGIGIGKPFFLNRNELKVHETKANPAHEIKRYRYALSRTKQDIKRVLKKLEAESADEGVLILETQLEMLNDPMLTSEVENQIECQQKNAEFILHVALEGIRERFKSINHPFFEDRFKDFEELTRRVFSYLFENGPINLKNIPPDTIICASELTATDAAEAESSLVSAFLTENGGPTTHAAIIAKSKGIPFISNVNLDLVKENTHQTIIVDGRTGEILLKPSREALEEYAKLKLALQTQSVHFKKVIPLASETYDGFHVRLNANIDMPQEAHLVHELGGGGIGLFRSEYLFLLKEQAPTEDEQVEIYTQLIKEMKGKPVVIRTFDLGGDKSFFYPAAQNNSYFGSRVARFIQNEPKLFKSQLRAIIRANQVGNVSILFPMIATLDEFKIAKKMLKEAKEELGLFQPIRKGCMIEIPSAALLVDQLATECDFISIGTNDLLQYTLAVDRSDHSLSELYDPSDPSIIRLMKLIAMEANKAKVPVSICGELAADPRYTPLLLGLGVQELSIAPRHLPVIKNVIRSTRIVEAVQLAERILEMNSSSEVMSHLSAFYRKNVAFDLCYV
ncbi:MAG: phosphoenolpyruvate--protein phosphotransferase [Parachlamydia sp.]|jgi:phosphotransferase system enzyme I (PtsI)|nr:phosphoenolpyruvate--protein phosphotransferase [Parachlamydia sp.]